MTGNSKTSKRTIIVLTDDFPPTTGGGIATWAKALSDDLVSMGENVIVMVRKKKKQVIVPQVENLAQIKYVAGRDWNLYRWFYMLFKIIPLLLRQKNVVIVASIWQHIEAIVYLRAIFNFTIICFAHGTDISKIIFTRKNKRLKRVLNRIDLFAPVSHFHDRLVRAQFSDLNYMSKVIHNGIDSDRFVPIADKKSLRKKFNIQQQSPAILSVGRIIETKGYRYLVRALSIVVKQFPDTICIFAGKPKQPEFAKLQELIDELKLNRNILFLSSVEYDKLPELYNACDIFALASHPVFQPYYQEDNFPMVILEASACQLPVVATQCGGIPEIIVDGVSGFVVPLDDYQLFAEKLILLIKHPELRTRMGKFGRQRVLDSFDIKNVSNILLQQIQIIESK